MTEGADLQINVSKAKVICLGGSRKNRAIKSVVKNCWVKNVPNQDKKTEAQTWGAQFSVHRHWKQGKILNRTNLVWLYHTNVTKEHKSLNFSSVKIPKPGSLSNLIENYLLRFFYPYDFWKGLDLFEIRKKWLRKVYVNYAHSAWFVCWLF